MRCDAALVPLIAAKRRCQICPYFKIAAKMSEVMQQQQFKDQGAYPQVSVIRVDKKTSLLVYRQDAGESILQNANEPQHNPTFASTLKSIFTPSGNVFSAEAARAKNDSSGRRSLSAPGYKDVDSKNGRSRAESSTSSLDSGSTGESSPKVSFAPLPEAEVCYVMACNLAPSDYFG